METTLFFFIVYIFIGFFAGIIGGLLGIGGGVITVPCFFIIFTWMGYLQGDLMPVAVGTSLAAMIFNTLSATLVHHSKNIVKWEIFKKMSPGLFIGSVFGTTLTLWLPEVVLEVFFGVFLCTLSTIYFRKEMPHFSFSGNHTSFILRLASFVIGTLSSILGIGGGVLTVPLLMAIKIPDKNAIGTSSAITLLVATLGTISYIFFGWKSDFSSENIGFVNVPAFLTVGIMTFLSAPIGAKLTHQLPISKIRHIFAIVLIMTGLTFISLNLLPFL
jgi:uncharacterized membrane protein YfcA